MGGRNMQMVAKWLENAEVKLQDWSGRDRAIVPGCKRIRSLDEGDLAMILTIAHKQHDVDSDYPDEECLCYGGEKYLAKLMRLSEWKFEESRAFLVANNLISYSPHEDNCLDVEDPNKRTDYDYVYRLNKVALASLKRGPLKDKDTLPSKAEGLAQQDERPCSARTKNRCKIRSRSSTGEDAAAAEENDDYKWAEEYRTHIVRKWGLTKEQGNTIGLEGLVAGTAQKPPEEVDKVIDGFSHDDRLQKPNKLGTLIGSLIKKLKAIPKTSDALPPFEEFKKQFSPAQPVPAPQGVSSREIVFKAGFDRLVLKQNLADATDEQVNEIKAAFVKAFQGESDRRLNLAFDTFINNLPPPVDDVAARCATILSALNNSALKVNR